MEELPDKPHVSAAHNTLSDCVDNSMVEHPVDAGNFIDENWSK